MLRFRLSDLPASLRQQAERQLSPSKTTKIPPTKKTTSPKGKGKGNKNNTPSLTTAPTTSPTSSPSTQVTLPLVSYVPTHIATPPTRIDRSSKMSATEKRYQDNILQGKGRFEAITLILPGGSRYTPDFLTIEDGIVTLTEVKGSYRLGSQGRAITAFREAASYYPFFRFVWAEENKSPKGTFTRKTIPALNEAVSTSSIVSTSSPTSTKQPYITLEGV